MFKSTKPHQDKLAHRDKLNGYQYSIRTGIQIPENAVNLAYFHNRPLHPLENISISDTSKFVIENANQELNNQYIMFPDEENILRHDGDYNLESELFDVTDKFIEDTPLFYRYKLYHYHYDTIGPDRMGRYQGSTIKLLHSGGRDVDQRKHKYSIYLAPTVHENVYEVFVYTSFVLNTSNIMNVNYNAVIVKTTNGVHELDIIPEHKERINPQSFFLKEIDYRVHEGNSDRVNCNKIQVFPYIITDNRDLLDFSFKVMTTDGAFVSNPIPAKAINQEYALFHERSSFISKGHYVTPKHNGRFMTGRELLINHLGIPATQLNGKTFIAKFHDDSLTINNKKHISIGIDPEGNSPVFVETTYKTGVNLPDGTIGKLMTPDCYIADNGFIIPGYGVKLRDHRQIKVKHPMEDQIFENWYPRVQYGRFTRIFEDNGTQLRLYYHIPEYNNQEYSGVYGKPYVDVTQEEPQVINQRTIKVKFSPLHVRLNNGRTPSNLAITREDAFGRKQILDIATWNATDGTIELHNLIKSNDRLQVNYTYEEETFLYRGFVDEQYSEFVNIDLNPNQYHTIKLFNNHSYISKPTHVLFNRILHVFMRPAVCAEIGGSTESILYSNKTVLYHSFDDVPQGKYDILLGKIYLRHNTTLDNVEVQDTRTRGGGVIEDMYEPLMRELEPESDYYWDIGYWDGEPYSENAVVIIKLDRRILKEFGGRFTPQEVEKAVMKWISYGTMPIIEYVSTYSKEDSPNTSKTVTSIHKNRIEYSPEFTASTYNQMESVKVNASYTYINRQGYGIIKLIDSIDERKLYGRVYERPLLPPNPNPEIGTVKISNTPDFSISVINKSDI